VRHLSVSLLYEGEIVVIQLSDIKYNNQMCHKYEETIKVD